MPPPIPADRIEQIAAAIHYPECWDTMAYPTLESALDEMFATFQCSNDQCARPSVAAPAGVPDGWRDTVSNIANNLGEFAGSMQTQAQCDTLTAYADQLFAMLSAAPNAPAEAPVGDDIMVIGPYKVTLFDSMSNSQLLATQTPTAPADAEQTKAAADVLAERKRQQDVEGWTPEHDDEHDAGELGRAAAAYACYSCNGFKIPDEIWPWSIQWWKPTASPRRALVKAGALILAEIERLDRSAATDAAMQGKESS